jgi:hypothetical protein
LESARADADWAVTEGFDGIAVFEPASVSTAMNVFERHLGVPARLWDERGKLIPGAHDVFSEKVQGPNQLGVMREDVAVSADDLLRIPRLDTC